MKKVAKIFGITIGLIVVSIVVLVIAFNPPNDTQSPLATSEPSQQSSILTNAMDLSPVQEDEIITLFSSAGIGEIVSASLFQTGETQTSYHVHDAETFAYRYPIVVWMSNDEKVVDTIYYRDNDIYDDNAVIAKVSEFYVSEAERKTVTARSKEYVLDAMVYPLSAEFKNSWAFDKQGENIVVQNTVTAQNAFGVMSDLFFQIIFDSWQIPISIIIDGQEFIENQ